VSSCGSTFLGAQGTGKPPDACDDVGGPTELDLYFYQGDDEKRTVRWEDPPGTAAANLTNAEIEMQIREDNADVQPTVLCEASVGDGITITNGANAEFEVVFSAAKTVLLRGSKPYVYDLQVTPAGGLRTTILRGKVYFDLERTR
jgi:hypothetical protein